MPRLEKGESGPLNVTKEARHRVFVGLGWDPNYNPGILESIREMFGGRKTWHDLNLSCFLFDRDLNHVESVSDLPGEAANSSVHVYHSGDSTEGVGDGDDEQISVELKNLPDSIHHVVFTAAIKSGQNFGDVGGTEIRLGDGYSNHIFLSTGLSKPATRSAAGYVFVRLFREGDGWRVHYIDEPFRPTENQPLPGLVKKLAFGA